MQSGIPNLDTKEEEITLPRGYTHEYIKSWKRKTSILIFKERLRENVPQIRDGIVRIIMDYNYKTQNAYSINSWRAPDGQIYQPSELAVWVTNPLHAPFGPCPTCIQYGQTYQQGASPQYLWEIMQSAEHTAIHIDSRVHNPVCYCRIVPLRDVNLYHTKSLIHETENGISLGVLPLNDELKMRLCSFFMEVGQSIQAFSENKVNQLMINNSLLKSCNTLAERYIEEIVSTYTDTYNPYMTNDTSNDPLFAQVNRDTASKASTFGEMR
jgi:hypothetical protein